MLTWYLVAALRAHWVHEREDPGQVAPLVGPGRGDEEGNPCFISRDLGTVSQRGFSEQKNLRYYPTSTGWIVTFARKTSTLLACPLCSNCARLSGCERTSACDSYVFSRTNHFANVIGVYPGPLCRRTPSPCIRPRPGLIVFAASAACCLFGQHARSLHRSGCLQALSIKHSVAGCLEGVFAQAGHITKRY